LATVDCLEVVETVDGIESVVIGELLFGDRFFSLQAKDRIDVLLLLDVRKSSPRIA